ncbi:WhiB family transcriptional regulator [Actinoplanes sp. NPDC051851]|uniref:WhiB family transcriptional regulator n=1 Tax=Actinoplanes sp. NPDC051851 TaxID=3154753 RepID=UPI003425E1B3
MDNRPVYETREGCDASRHDTANAYRKSRCRCPQARAAEQERNRKYENRPSRRSRVRSGQPCHSQPGVPAFYLDPSRGYATVDPDVMFPDTNGDSTEAKKACGACPFARECHTWAVETKQWFGVWGGVDEKTRRAEITRRRAVAA